MIISVREFDHIEKRVLCHTREEGQDRVKGARQDYRSLERQRQSLLNDKEANVGLSDSNGGLAAVHCPNCPDQGYYIYETGGENDTRECHQEQCQFCYETPNSVFNIACAAEAANVPLERRD